MELHKSEIPFLCRSILLSTIVLNDTYYRLTIYVSLIYMYPNQNTLGVKKGAEKSQNEKEVKSKWACIVLVLMEMKS